MLWRFLYWTKIIWAHGKKSSIWVGLFFFYHRFRSYGNSVCLGWPMSLMCSLIPLSYLTLTKIRTIGLTHSLFFLDFGQQVCNKNVPWFVISALKLASKSSNDVKFTTWLRITSLKTIPISVAIQGNAFPIVTYFSHLFFFQTETMGCFNAWCLATWVVKQLHSTPSLNITWAQEVDSYLVVLVCCKERYEKAQHFMEIDGLYCLLCQPTGCSFRSQTFRQGALTTKFLLHFAELRLWDVSKWNKTFPNHSMLWIYEVSASC